MKIRNVATALAAIAIPLLPSNLNGIRAVVSLLILLREKSS